MTAATVSTNGQRPNIDEQRAAARGAYRQSLADGKPLSGAALGRQFAMSDRWGRDRVTEVQRADASDDAKPDGTRVLDPAPQHELSSPSPVMEAPPDSDGPSTGLDGDDPDVAEGGSWLDSLIILAVAAVAAAASYGHMLEVAVLGGEPVWLARAFPITVDGLVLAALRSGRHGRWWLALGIAVSVAANMLSRYPELAADAGPVISAWPPIALFGTHRLLRGAHHKASQR